MKEQALSLRELYNHSDVIHRRETLQAEINKDKIIIDRTVFQKTPEEKDLLKRLKTSWKVKYQP